MASPTSKPPIAEINERTLHLLLNAAFLTGVNAVLKDLTQGFIRDWFQVEVETVHERMPLHDGLLRMLDRYDPGIDDGDEEDNELLG